VSSSLYDLTLYDADDAAPTTISPGRKVPLFREIFKILSPETKSQLFKKALAPEVDPTISSLLINEPTPTLGGDEIFIEGIDMYPVPLFDILIVEMVPEAVNSADAVAVESPEFGDPMVTVGLL